MKRQTVTIITAALLGLTVAGCGSADPTDNMAGEQQSEKKSCDSLRSEVIRIAATNGVNIVKIYDPKVVKEEPKKTSCSGRALVSSGQEAILYYRDYQDDDGEWLVQYAEQPLD
jgi:hypothetical protein